MVLKQVSQSQTSTLTTDTSSTKHQSNIPPINLLRGWPNPSLLPTNALLGATNSVLTNHPLATQGLLYGPDEGHLPLRQSLATWLSTYYASATDQWRRSLPASAGVKTTVHNKPTEDGQHGLNPPTTGAERISITGGASQSLGVILFAVTDPLYTRRIWIVAPGYFMVWKIFEDAGFAGHLTAVPEIQSGANAGPDIDWLRGEMQRVDDEEGPTKDENSMKPKEKYEKIYRHVIYTVPSFANPSSLTTTLAAREALVRCARDFDALVICDDVYDMLLWPADPDSSSTSDLEGKFESPLPRVVDIDRYLDDGATKFGNVVSNGSFSKICAPGCRCGWVEAAPALAYSLSQAGITKSGGAPSQLTSLFLHSLLTTPAPSKSSPNPSTPSPTIPEYDVLTNHIFNTLRPTYARRHTRLVSAIQTHLVPYGITLPQPDRVWCGGYFVWLTLPEPLRGAEVAARALKEEGVVVAKGELFEVPRGARVGEVGKGSGEKEGEGGDGTKFPRNIRLCFAWEDEDMLEEGVERVGRLIGRMLEELEEGVIVAETGKVVESVNQFA